MAVGLSGSYNRSEGYNASFWYNGAFGVPAQTAASGRHHFTLKRKHEHKEREEFHSREIIDKLLAPEPLVAQAVVPIENAAPQPAAITEIKSNYEIELLLLTTYI